MQALLRASLCFALFMAIGCGGGRRDSDSDGSDGGSSDASVGDGATTQDGAGPDAAIDAGELPPRTIVTAIPREEAATHPKILLDPSGAVVIVFLSAAEGEVRLATRGPEEETFAITSIEGTSGIEWLDATMSEGTVHFVAGRAASVSEKLIYGTFEAGEARIDRVETDHATYTTAGAVEPAIAGGPGGLIAIAFTSPENEVLGYVERRGDLPTWHFRLVTATLIPPRSVELALDSQGIPHLAYTLPMAAHRDPFYARYDATMQVFVENQQPFFVGDEMRPIVVGDIAFGLSPAGVANIALWNDMTGAVLHYRRTDTYAWELAYVDAGPDARRHVDLAVGIDERVHIVFTDDEAGILRYAAEGDAFFADDFTPPSTPGAQTYQTPSIAVDAQGLAHVAYRDDAQGTIVYARLAP